MPNRSVFEKIHDGRCLLIFLLILQPSVLRNHVLVVLMLNTAFGALFMSPFLVMGILDGNYGFGNSLAGHGMILLKSMIVLGSWLLGYFAIKHLPLTVQGRKKACRSGIRDGYGCR